MNRSLLTAATVILVAAAVTPAAAADKLGHRQIVVQPSSRIASANKITPFLVKAPEGGTPASNIGAIKILKPPVGGRPSNHGPVQQIVRPPEGSAPSDGTIAIKLVRPPIGATPGNDRPVQQIVKAPDGNVPFPVADDNQFAASDSAPPAQPLLAQPDDAGTNGDVAADDGADNAAPADETASAAPDQPAADAPVQDTGGAVKLFNALIARGYDVDVLRHDSLGHYVFLVTSVATAEGHMLLIDGASGAVLKQRVAVAADYRPLAVSDYAPRATPAYRYSAEDNCDDGYAAAYGYAPRNGYRLRVQY